MTRPRTEARQAFDESLKTIVAPWLKAREFRRRGGRFARWVGRNYQVIEFVGGRFSSQFDFRGSVGFGIYYEPLREFDEFPMKRDLPRESDCHWRSAFTNEDPLHFVIRTRSGSFGPATPAQVFDHFLRDLLDRLAGHWLPLLDRYSDDAVVAELWRREGYEGLPRTKRLQWLAIDLARSGPSAALAEVLQELEDSVRELQTHGADSNDPHVTRIQRTIREARERAGLGNRIE